MHHREQVLHRPGQGRRIRPGAARGETPPQLGAGEHLRAEDPLRVGDQVGEVDAGGAPAEGVALRAGQQRRQHRSQDAEVGRGEQVLRGPHRRRADQPPGLDRRGERADRERRQPGVQGEVGIVGVLRVQPAQPLGGRDDVEVVAAQQQLAREGGPVERAPVEPIRRRADWTGPRTGDDLLPRRTGHGGQARPPVRHRPRPAGPVGDGGAQRSRSRHRARQAASAASWKSSPPARPRAGRGASCRR